MTILAALILSLSGVLPRLADKVLVRADVVEINHVTCLHGRMVVDQIIVWRWSPDYRRYDCQTWALLSHCRFSKQGDTYIVRTPNATIRTGVLQETWTNHDPERENARLFPSQLRVTH